MYGFILTQIYKPFRYNKNNSEKSATFSHFGY